MVARGRRRLRSAAAIATATLALLCAAAGNAYACPADGASSDVPQSARDHICGAWDAATARFLDPGIAMNSTHKWGNGYIRDFDNGYFGRGGIMERDGVGWAYIVGSTYWTNYVTIGGATGSALGYPKGRFEFGGHLNDGPRENQYMTFEGGVMNKWAAGTFATQGAILDKWNALGGVTGVLGRPLSNEYRTAALNGAASHFEGGYITYNPRIPGAFMTRGAILDKYIESNSSSGVLGLPSSDPRHNDAHGNDYQTFDGGVINSWGVGTFITRGAILDRWNRGGGPDGLGLPTSDEGDTLVSSGHSTPGRYSKFERGVINSSAYGTFVVGGGIGKRYAQLGYSGSHLGLPTSEEQPWQNGGVRQLFESGYIYWHPGDDAGHTNDDCPIDGGDAPGGVKDHMCAAWNAAGFPSLGHPINAIHRWGDGWAVDIDGGNWGRGAIMEGDGEGFAYVVAEPYWGALLRAGGVSRIGYPTGRHEFAGHLNDGPKANRYMTFQDGVINNSAHGAFASHGAIRARWEAMGNVSGALGLPVSDEGDTARVPGRYQLFEGGDLIWDPTTGKTWHVYGGILNKYKSLGYSAHPLGLPTGDRALGPRGNDYQTFQGGVINQYGGNAYETHGAILDRWNASGNVSGPLGLPTTDEFDTARSPQGTTGRYERFEHGVINYNPKVNRTVVIGGAILDRYAAAGYAASYLGLPTGEEYNFDGGKRQDFEGGYIVWHAGGLAETDQEVNDVADSSLVDDPPGGGDYGGGGPDGDPGSDDGTSGGAPPTPPEKPQFKVRALGDSVTAAFGYYPNGDTVPIGKMPGCVNKLPDNDCSSPNRVSYAAVWTRRHNLLTADPTVFRNYAVSGATPADWLGGGRFNGDLNRIVDDKPSLTVMTLGANPLLSNFLTASAVGDLAGCAKNAIHLHTCTIPNFSKLCKLPLISRALAECIRFEIWRLDVEDRLLAVYSRLLDAPGNSLVVMQYHQADPWLEDAKKAKVLLDEINAASLRAISRLPAEKRGRVRSPWPGPFDRHPCDWGDPPSAWVIVADTCIHPSAEGHRQFANAIDGIYEDSDPPGAHVGLPAKLDGDRFTTRGASVTVAADERATIVVEASLGHSARRLRAASATPHAPLAIRTLRVERGAKAEVIIKLGKKGVASVRKAGRLRITVRAVDTGGNMSWVAKQVAIRP